MARENQKEKQTERPMPLYEYQHETTGERRESMRPHRLADTAPWPGPWKRVLSLPSPPMLATKAAGRVSEGESLRRMLYRAEAQKPPALRDIMRCPKTLKMLKADCAS